MSSASDAYTKAEKAIADALETGATELDLSGLSELTQLPPQIAQLTFLTKLHLGKFNKATKISDLAPLQGLTALQFLYLGNTQVTDITPLQGMDTLQTLFLSNTQVADITSLQGMDALQSLDLRNTQVTDIAPLQRLGALQHLFLSYTRVADIAPLQRLYALQHLGLIHTLVANITPLRGLDALQSLQLDNTQVLDLRPISGFSFDQDTPRPGVGLHFLETPAAAASPELSRLSQIKDNKTRTRDTLAYLRTLPPWPAPMAWDRPAPPLADIPAEQPAPLQVTEIDGILHLANPGDDLDQADSQLAELGWAELCDYLQLDLKDQRPRIHNTMPRLAHALDRLEGALGTEYAKMNPIAVGTQANRVMHLAKLAPEMLMDEDAADIAGFSAALALLIERFPIWRAYRAAAFAAPPAPLVVKQAIPDFTDAVAAFMDHPEIDPGIADNLNRQIEATSDDPSDSITAIGLAKSLGNVLSALATRAKPIFRLVAAEIGDIAKMSWTGIKKVIAGSIASGVTGIAGAGLDIFANNAGVLKALAAQFPEHLDWVLKFLNAFGL